ncbi:hypothetical protein BU26DRAFT_121572 [Trematosphaeria pertusa]|uniref:Uncharacterized protein n=1 Tax=Trematosphaeria pertusa TaxID=390896 RepID=A0A6A6HY03_9PLEO|nr:uncharacterized protein BU26DRAFT_121572 [Trematosphaeria pertusa]KAF2242926.1 hypothetical protein BU26DRAFT_121572 [Trematosphaeria pertusa]
MPKPIISHCRSPSRIELIMDREPPSLEVILYSPSKPATTSQIQNQKKKVTNGINTRQLTSPTPIAGRARLTFVDRPPVPLASSLLPCLCAVSYGSSRKLTYFVLQRKREIQHGTLCACVRVCMWLDGDAGHGKVEKRLRGLDCCTREARHCGIFSW